MQLTQLLCSAPTAGLQAVLCTWGVGRSAARTTGSIQAPAGDLGQRSAPRRGGGGGPGPRSPHIRHIHSHLQAVAEHLFSIFRAQLGLQLGRVVGMDGLPGSPGSRRRSCLGTVRQAVEAAAATRGLEDPMGQRSGQACRNDTWLGLGG